MKLRADFDTYLAALMLIASMGWVANQFATAGCAPVEGIDFTPVRTSSSSTTAPDASAPAVF